MRERLKGQAGPPKRPVVVGDMLFTRTSKRWISTANLKEDILLMKRYNHIDSSKRATRQAHDYNMEMFREEWKRKLDRKKLTKPLADKKDEKKKKEIAAYLRDVYSDSDSDMDNLDGSSLTSDMLKSSLATTKRGKAFKKKLSKKLSQTDSLLTLEEGEQQHDGLAVLDEGAEDKLSVIKSARPTPAPPASDDDDIGACDQQSSHAPESPFAMSSLASLTKYMQQGPGSPLPEIPSRTRSVKSAGSVEPPEPKLPPPLMRRISKSTSQLRHRTSELQCDEPVDVPTITETSHVAISAEEPSSGEKVAKDQPQQQKQQLETGGIGSTDRLSQVSEKVIVSDKASDKGSIAGTSTDHQQQSTGGDKQSVQSDKHGGGVQSDKHGGSVHSDKHGGSVHSDKFVGSVKSDKPMSEREKRLAEYADITSVSQTQITAQQELEVDDKQHSPNVNFEGNLLRAGGDEGGGSPEQKPLVDGKPREGKPNTPTSSCFSKTSMDSATFQLGKLNLGPKAFPPIYMMKPRKPQVRSWDTPYPPGTNDEQLADTHHPQVRTVGHRKEHHELQENLHEQLADLKYCRYLRLPPGKYTKAKLERERENRRLRQRQTIYVVAAGRDFDEHDKRVIKLITENAAGKWMKRTGKKLALPKPSAAGGSASGTVTEAGTSANSGAGSGTGAGSAVAANNTAAGSGSTMPTGVAPGSVVSGSHGSQAAGTTVVASGTGTHATGTVVSDRASTHSKISGHV